MRAAGALIFGLAAIVNYIVCPSFPAGYYPRDETIPPDYRTVVVTPEEYPGAHSRDRVNGNLHLIEMPFGVFAKGDIIVGMNCNGHVRPIYNSEKKVTIRNIETRMTEVITLVRAHELGLMYILVAEAKAMARARASIEAQVPLDGPNSTSG